MSTGLTVIISIIAGATGAFFGAYLREKGKNFATKEDIKAITKIQEEIRTELANHSHFSRARYNHEVEIYKDLWPKLVEFYRTSYLLDPRSAEDGKRFNQIKEEVQKAIRDKKPFFSDGICKELLAFQYLCEDKRFLEIVSLTAQLTEEKRNSYLELQKQIQSQLEKVEKAIRDRLIKFD
jgi:hypothetical protein